MLEFLISLLLFVFGLGSVDHPSFDPEETVSRIEEHISDLGEPQGDPVNSHQGGQEIAENGPDLPDQAQNSNNSSQNNENESNGNGNNGENQENASHPDTNKIRAYNTSSGKLIASVATIAVEKAPPLEDCTDNAECEDPAPEPEDLLPPDSCDGPAPDGGWCHLHFLPTPTPEPSPVPAIIPIKPPCGCPPPLSPQNTLGDIKCLHQAPVVCLE